MDVYFQNIYVQRRIYIYTYVHVDRYRCSRWARIETNAQLEILRARQMCSYLCGKYGSNKAYTADSSSNRPIPIGKTWFFAVNYLFASTRVTLSRYMYMHLINMWYLFIYMHQHQHLYISFLSAFLLSRRAHSCGRFFVLPARARPLHN